MLADQGVPFIQRHGPDPFVPPHLIDHPLNMARLTEAACDRVLAVSSVGSTRPEIPVASLVCPDDYIALSGAGSALADARGHGTRPLSGPWRDRVLAAWAEAGAGPLRVGGVYWQSPGPRFETPAEVRLISPHAELVGMTVASECVAAQEAGLEYAAICVVDNLANGVGGAPLTLEEFERGKAAGVAGLSAALGRLVPALLEVRV